MIRPHRHHPLWFAFILHRLSGVGLALFLPFHFNLLGKALTSPEAMDESLKLAELPLVKVAEFGLVFLLAVHAFGGIRLLALEFLPWSNRQKTFAASAVAASFLISGTFILQAV